MPSNSIPVARARLDSSGSDCTMNDITKFGARSTNQNLQPQIPGITVKIDAGSTAARLSDSSTFQNGDGVTSFGAGKLHAMPTPGAPMVIPSVAAANTGTGIVVPGPVGIIPYPYQIIARSKHGGLTAASSVGSTAAGSALGSQNVAIKSLARVGVFVTVETVAPHGLASGAMATIAGTDDPTYFDGWYRVTVIDPTHFSYEAGYDIDSGASPSASGGTATWFNCNHLTWDAVPGAFVYYIYGLRAAGMALLGVSLPTKLWWDDFGSPMMDHFLGPYYVPLTPPTVATSEHLTTTIVSGAGTVNLVLADPASTSVTAGTILYDDVPAILAAIHESRYATGKMAEVPHEGWLINSYCFIDGPQGLSQPSSLYLNDTLDLGNEVRWSGLLKLGNWSTSSMAFEGLSTVWVNRANPGVWSESGTGPVRGLEFASLAMNNARLVVYGGMNQETFEDIAWNSDYNGTGNDYMGVGLTVLGNSDVMFNSFKRTALIGGPRNEGFNGKACAPAIMFLDHVGNMTFDGISMCARGLFLHLNGNGPHIIFKFGRIQGGLEPMLTLWNDQAKDGCVGGSIDIQEIESDTTGMPIIANLGECLQYMKVTFRGMNAPSNGLGLITGPAMKMYIEFADGPYGQNIKVAAPADGYFSDNSLQVDGVLGSVGHRMAAPGLLESAVVSAGGAVWVGKVGYAVSAVDAFGYSTFLSRPIYVDTTLGNQTVTLTPPKKIPPGTVGLYYWRNINGSPFGITGSSSGVIGPFPPDKPFVDVLGFQAYDSPSNLGRALSSGFSAKGIETHTLVLAPTKVADLPLAAPSNNGWIRLVTNFSGMETALVRSDGNSWKRI